MVGHCTDTPLLDASSGAVRALRPLDREEAAVHHLVVRASNPAPPHLSATAAVTITLQVLLTCAGVR